MSFDPTTFCFSSDDASDLSDDQVDAIRCQSPNATTRDHAAAELSERESAMRRRVEAIVARVSASEQSTQRHRDALAAFDKVYLPLRHKVGPDDDLELSIRGDDVHALLFLCELGMISVGINPDNGCVED